MGFIVNNIALRLQVVQIEEPAQIKEHAIAILFIMGQIVLYIATITALVKDEVSAILTECAYAMSLITVQLVKHIVIQQSRALQVGIVQIKGVNVIIHIMAKTAVLTVIRLLLVMEMAYVIRKVSANVPPDQVTIVPLPKAFREVPLLELYFQCLFP